MKKISSLDNQLIKDLAKLSLSKERKKQNKFIAEGLRICSTIIDAGFKPIDCLVTEEHYKQMLSLVPESAIAIVSDLVMKKISSATTPSGIICTFALPEAPDPKLLGLGLVLAQIADPGNMGTLI